MNYSSYLNKVYKPNIYTEPLVKGRLCKNKKCITCLVSSPHIIFSSECIFCEAINDTVKKALLISIPVIILQQLFKYYYPL